MLAFSLVGCDTPAQSEVMDPTVVVETTAAQTGTLSSESTYIGTISAEGTANVVSMVSGTVKAVDVAVGDTVTAGQFLCKFDDKTAQLSLESAQASYQSALTGVSSAQAGLESAQQSYQGAVAGYGGTEDGSLAILEDQVRMAQDNYDDTQALFQIGTASQLEVDQANQNLLSAQAGLKTAQSNLASVQAGVASAQAGLQTAQAGVQSAQVGVDSAEHQLTFYNLTAPISGVIEAVNVTKNNFTASGSVAFIISNAKNKTVTFYVTDEVRQQLAERQSVAVSVRGTTYTGQISEISGVVDVSTGLFQIKALVNGAQELPDGLTVELTTTSHTVENAIILPCDALYFDNGVAYVYVVRDGKAVLETVTVALYTSEQAAITDGLSEGDTVITTWSATLKDGAPIQLASEVGQDDGSQAK